MKVKCKRCQKEFEAKPSRIKQGRAKYCSKECRNPNNKTIEKQCPVCGTIFTASVNGRKTCSDKCSKVRNLPKESREAISKALSKNYKKQCPTCGKEFISRKKKYCSTECRKIHKKPYYKSEEFKLICSAGGKATISKQITSSKIEEQLSSIINHSQQRNIKIGEWEIDILIDKIAIEYNGPWHYRPIMGHKNLNNVKNRDILKQKHLRDSGYVYHPVFWTQASHDRIERLRKESYFIEQTLLYLNSEYTPFYFPYDRELFVNQYDKLKSKNIKKPTIHMYCADLIEFYHKHIWFMNTKSNENAIQHWEKDRDRIIANRIKYADLSPRSIRRYFRLFDITPSTFQDSLGKYMANMINGDMICDPFAGFGGRMLGTCASGRTYKGFDNNIETVNANQAIISDFQLDAECILADSSKLHDIECDGIITSPPFYNKDNYGLLYNSLDDFIECIRSSLSNFIIRDKAIIDFKPVSGCSLEDFKKSIPWKIIDVVDINFGGLNRNSIHHWIVCR